MTTQHKAADIYTQPEAAAEYRRLQAEHAKYDPRADDDADQAAWLTEHARSHVYGQRPRPAPIARTVPASFATRLYQVALGLVLFAALSGAAAYAVLVLLPAAGWR